MITTPRGLTTLNMNRTPTTTSPCSEAPINPSLTVQGSSKKYPFDFDNIYFNNVHTDTPCNSCSNDTTDNFRTSNTLSDATITYMAQHGFIPNQICTSVRSINTDANTLQSTTTSSDRSINSDIPPAVHIRCISDDATYTNLNHNNFNIEEQHDYQLSSRNNNSSLANISPSTRNLHSPVTNNSNTPHISQDNTNVHHDNPNVYISKNHNHPPLPLNMTEILSSQVHNLYVDGSWKHTKKSSYAGWAVVVICPSDSASAIHEFYGPVITDSTSRTFMGATRHSNNTGELTAIGESLNWIIAHNITTPVNIWSDSEYAIACCMGTNSPVQNIHLIHHLQELYGIVQKNVTLYHIKAHTGHKYNERADCLAKRGSTGEAQLIPTTMTPRKHYSPLAAPRLVSSKVPLAVHSSLPENPCVEPHEFLRQFSDDSTQLSLYEVYEWAACKAEIAEKDKCTKQDFTTLQLHQQLRLIQALGYNLTSIHQALQLIIDSVHPRIPFHTTPISLEAIGKLTISQLVQYKHSLRSSVHMLQTLQRKLHHAILARMKPTHSSELQQGDLLHYLDQCTELKQKIQLQKELCSKITARLKHKLSSSQKTRRPQDLQDINQIVSSDRMNITWQDTLRFHHQLKAEKNNELRVLTLPDPTSTDSHAVELQSIGPPKISQLERYFTHTYKYTNFDVCSNPLDGQLLTTATININTITVDKAVILARLMEAHKIDILCVVDTRASNRLAKMCSKKFREQLGPGTQTHHSSPQANITGTSTHVGGIMIIIGPKWGIWHATFQDDPTSLGILQGVTIHTPNSPLMIIATYWPYVHATSKRADNELPNSVYARLDEWLHRQHPGLDPIQYLQTIIGVWISTAKLQSVDNCFLMGDFNIPWTTSSNTGSTSSTMKFVAWAQLHELSNPTYEQSPLFHNTNNFTYEQYSTKKSQIRKTGQTVIDHILHSHVSVQYKLCQVGLIHGDNWHLTKISDHNILVNTYQTDIIPGGCSRSKVLLPKGNSSHDLNLDKDSHVRFYKGKISEWTQSRGERAVDAETTLDDLTTYSVQLVQQLYKRRRKKKFLIYKAPIEYSIYQGLLDILLKIRKRLKGSKHNQPIADTKSYRKLMDQVWKTQLKTYSHMFGLSPDSIKECMKLSSPTVDWWYAQDIIHHHEHILDSCSNAIKTTVKQLNKIRRISKQKQYKQFHNKRETLRTLGRLKQVITSMLGDTKTKCRNYEFTLDALRLNNGQLETEPQKIHNTLTKEFDQWYTGPIDLQYYTGPQDLEQAKYIMHDLAYFQEITKHTGVPSHLIELFHSHIQSKVSPQVRLELQESLAAPPTYEEFVKRITRVSRDSTPGPSGLTYNMIKAWDNESKKAAYVALAQIWESKLIPRSWKWRWLVVIPKTKETHPYVKSLRPITMVEAIRKIWLSLINNRIQTIWTKHHVLHKSQHGSREGHGTCSASIVHVQHLEHILHQYGHLHRSSWDMKRAFDSVSKLFIRISWLRLGVPDDIVDWIVKMDEGGYTIVYSPEATRIWEQYRYNSVPGTTHKSSVMQDSSPSSKDVNLEPIVAKRGTGQGDVVSPSLWIAFLDILLNMLDDDSTMELYTYGENGQRRKVLDIAYVDDIESATGGSKHMQRKAEIVSAFCVLTSIELSPDKLRRSLQDNLGTITSWEEVQRTIVYSMGWSQHEVTVKVQGSTEYLGVIYDIQRAYSSSQHARNILTLTQQVNSVRISNASAITKNVTLISSVYSALIYKARMCAIPYSDMQTYDKILYPLLCHITKNRPTFPYALLHLSPEYGGIGLPQLSDRIHQEKLNIILRGLESPSCEMSHAAVRDILTQAYFDQSGQHPSTNQAIQIQGIHSCKGDDVRWIDSLLQWMDQYDLSFYRTGFQYGTSLTATESHKNLGKQWGIVCQEDLLCSIKGYHDILEALQLPSSVISITGCSTPTFRQGQFWTYKIDKGSPTVLFEVLGWDIRQDILYGNLWTVDGIGTISMDFGHLHQAISYAQLQHDDQFIQILVLHTHTRRQRIHRDALLHAPIYTLPPQYGHHVPTTTIEQISTFHRNHEQLQILTASSINNGELQLDDAFKAISQPTTTAYIIIKGSYRGRSTSSILTVTDCQQIGIVTTSQIELFINTIALVLSARLPTHPPVIPNTKLTFAQLLATRKYKPSITLKGSWLRSVAKAQLNAGAQLQQITSQIEQNRKISIQAIMKQLQTNTTPHSSEVYVSHSIQATRVWTELVPPNTWMVLQNNLPIMTSLQTCHQTIKYHRYLTQRDERYHANENVWRQSTPFLFSRCFSLPTGTVVHRSTISKIIYDWVYHGGNRYKNEPILSDADLRKRKCDNCSYIDSNYHWICQCEHPPSRLIRHKTVETICTLHHNLTEQYNRLITQEDSSHTSMNSEILRLSISLSVTHFYKQHNASQTWGARLWTSNWSPSMIHELTDRLILPKNREGRMIITFAIINTIRRIVIKCGQILAHGLEELWKCKASTIIPHPHEETTTTKNTTSPSLQQPETSSPVVTEAQISTSSLLTPPTSKPQAKRPTRRTRAQNINYNEDSMAYGLPNGLVPQSARIKIFHPTDHYANKRMYISKTDLPGVPGYGGFALIRLRRHAIIAEYKGGPSLTIKGRKKHTLSSYAFEDKKNNRIIDPYDPTTGEVACSAARINDNIQDPARWNCEFYVKGNRVVIRATRDIAPDEELYLPYGEGYWRDLSRSLDILLMAQRAYSMEKNSKWNALIAKKRKMEGNLNPYTNDDPPNESPPSQITQIYHQYYSSDFLVQEVSFDGNNMFNAIALRLKTFTEWTQYNPHTLRTLIILWMRNNEQSPIPQLDNAPLSSTVGIRYQSDEWMTYCDRMQTDGVQGDGTVLWAISIFFNINITLVTLNSRELRTAPHQTSRTIFLGLYCPYEYYCSLAPKESFQHPTMISTPRLDETPRPCRIRLIQTQMKHFALLSSALTYAQGSIATDTAAADYHFKWSTLQHEYLQTLPPRCGSLFLHDKLLWILKYHNPQEYIHEDLSIADIEYLLPPPFAIVDGQSTPDAEGYLPIIHNPHTEPQTGPPNCYLIIFANSYAVYCPTPVNLEYQATMATFLESVSADKLDLIPHIPIEAKKKKTIYKRSSKRRIQYLKFPPHAVCQYLTEYPDTDVAVKLKRQRENEVSNNIFFERESKRPRGEWSDFHFCHSIQSSSKKQILAHNSNVRKGKCKRYKTTPRKCLSVPSVLSKHQEQILIPQHKQTVPMPNQTIEEAQITQPRESDNIHTTIAQTENQNRKREWSALFPSMSAKDNIESLPAYPKSDRSTVPRKRRKEEIITQHSTSVSVLAQLHRHAASLQHMQTDPSKLSPVEVECSPFRPTITQLSSSHPRTTDRRKVSRKRSQKPVTPQHPSTVSVLTQLYRHAETIQPTQNNHNKPSTLEVEFPILIPTPQHSNVHLSSPLPVSASPNVIQTQSNTSVAPSHSMYAPPETMTPQSCIHTFTDESFPFQSVNATQRKNPQQTLHRLLQSKFNFHEVPGDGNCLFHAVTHQLQSQGHKNISAQRLRLQSTTWLRGHPDHTISSLGFQPITCTRETYLSDTWDSYCNNMTKPNVYGEPPHLWAITVLYQVNIHIFTIDGYHPYKSDHPNPAQIYLGHYAPLPHYASLTLKPRKQPSPLNPRIVEGGKKRKNTNSTSLSPPSKVSKLNHFSSVINLANVITPPTQTLPQSFFQVLEVPDTANTLLRYQTLMAADPTHDILFHLGTIPISTYSLQRLKSNEWLNHDIIDAYMHILSTVYPEVHFFQVGFYTQLVHRVYGYQYTFVRGARLVKRAQLFQKSKWIIPIHRDNSHWAVIYVDVSNHQIYYYDSKLYSGELHLQNIQKFISDSLQNIANETPSDHSWQIHNIYKDPHDTSRSTNPTQTGDSDCGVYILAFAHLICSNLNLHMIQQTHIPELRRRIGMLIVSKEK